jgi:DNA-binding HxlR family transcriptional regulator
MKHDSRPDAYAEAALVMSRVTSKWRPNIMRLLHDEPQRFSALRAAIPSISERMLVHSLRDLERDGVVLRTALSVKPPHVVYSLTAFGAGCARRVAALLEYVSSHQPACGERVTPSEARASISPPPREM